ncbi:MAG: alpha/beta hydrolase [Thermoplasmata archaeon]|nr:alpha/beta hydrolase [Thermoplasmata archaeon]
MATESRGDSLEVQGTGPGVLFLHGYPLQRAMWRPQLLGLSDSYRVGLLDLPGYGTAAAAPVPDTLAGFGEAIRRTVRDQMGGRATIVGHSFGGYIALQLYADHPELFERLVLVSTRSGADSPEAREKRNATARRLASPTEHLDVDEMAKSLLAEATWTEQGPVVAVTRAMVAAASNTTIVRTLSAIADRPDQTPRLGSIRVPTLVLWGANDRLIPPPQTRDLVGGIPGARGVEIEGAGHLGPLERPDAFNAALRGFLRESDASIRP